MSGGGGHVILSATQQTLTNPLVSGQMPEWMQLMISPFIGNDPSTWTQTQKACIAHAYGWCLLNCQ
jgi:hypothetical protein